MNKDGETGLGEYLRVVAGAIVADGRFDFDETTRLLEILKPLGEFDAKAVELRKTVEEVRADGVVTAEESAKLVALIKDFMAEAAHWSLATCPACKRTVPVSSLKGAARRCPVCGAEIPCGGQGTDRPTGGGERVVPRGGAREGGASVLEGADSGRGPDIRIADGTVAAVAATVRRHRPAFLAFAKVIRYATGDGEMEEGILGN